MLFCGKIIASGNILADPRKISLVEGMKSPKTQGEVRRMLGFFGYFRDQIPNYAEIAKPLIDLTTKRYRTHVPWEAKSAKLMRWALAHQPYSIVFQYYPDRKNVVADCLSRLQD